MQPPVAPHHRNATGQTNRFQRFPTRAAPLATESLVDDLQGDGGIVATIAGGQLNPECPRLGAHRFHRLAIDGQGPDEGVFRQADLEKLFARSPQLEHGLMPVVAVGRDHGIDAKRVDHGGHQFLGSVTGACDFKIPGVTPILIGRDDPMTWRIAVDDRNP